MSAQINFKVIIDSLSEGAADSLCMADFCSLYEYLLDNRLGCML